MKPFPSLHRKIHAFEEEKRDKNNPSSPGLIQFTRKTVSAKRSRERSYKRSMSRKLDIGQFTPSKAKRPPFPWAPLTTIKSTTTTSSMVTNTQKATSILLHLHLANHVGNGEQPAHFAFIQPQTLHLWSSNGWMRERGKRVKNSRRKRGRGTETEGCRTNCYHPVSPIYVPTHKEDAIPICDSKMKQALDPNYHPLNYVPKQGDDAPILVNNLIATPAKTKKKKTTREKIQKKKKIGKKTKTQDTGRRVRTRSR